ncbi:hypothetical protein ACF08W_11640 [Streptomyces sp. NPDC015144]|uniref:hypothetical protein n=1 Tax=Streptomyces sp. NPDC015144 TaxID=3364944 RepID=UPI003703066C
MLLVQILGVSACSAGWGGGSGMPPVSEGAIYGSWKGGGGESVEFEQGGIVRLFGFSCADLFPDGSGKGKIDSEGKWMIKSPRMGGEPWVEVTNSRSMCGVAEGSETGFYISEEEGSTVLHLRDPGMDEERLNFFKVME